MLLLVSPVKNLNMGISDLYKTVGDEIGKVTKPITDYFGPVKYVAPPAVVPTKPVLNKQKFLSGIASNETDGVKGNPYSFSQPSGNSKLGKALGKYQVTEGELKTYGKKYLGQSMTPQQFLASTTAQDNYMYNKAQALVSEGYTPEDIADIHNKGIKNSYPAGSGKYQNPEYVNNFSLIYNQ